MGTNVGFNLRFDMRRGMGIESKNNLLTKLILSKLFQKKFIYSSFCIINLDFLYIFGNHTPYNLKFKTHDAPIKIKRLL
jgi:hypothetical protein